MWFFFSLGFYLKTFTTYSHNVAKFFLSILHSVSREPKSAGRNFSLFPHHLSLHSLSPHLVSLPPVSPQTPSPSRLLLSLKSLWVLEIFPLWGGSRQHFTDWKVPQVSSRVDNRSDIKYSKCSNICTHTHLCVQKVCYGALSSSLWTLYELCTMALKHFGN